jgi:hypothetical protein
MVVCGKLSALQRLRARVFHVMTNIGGDGEDAEAGAEPSFCLHGKRARAGREVEAETMADAMMMMVTRERKRERERKANETVQVKEKDGKTRLGQRRHALFFEMQPSPPNSSSVNR